MNDKIYEIDADILRASHKCTRYYSCLFTRKEYCAIDRYVTGDGEIIFVKPSEHEDCTYMIPFGFSSLMCSCPARTAIYRKYGT